MSLELQNKIEKLGFSDTDFRVAKEALGEKLEGCIRVIRTIGKLSLVVDYERADPEIKFTELEYDEIVDNSYALLGACVTFRPPNEAFYIANAIPDKILLSKTVKTEKELKEHILYVLKDYDYRTDKGLLDRRSIEWLFDTKLKGSEFLFENLGKIICIRTVNEIKAILVEKCDEYTVITVEPSDNEFDLVEFCEFVITSSNSMCVDHVFIDKGINTVYEDYSLLEQSMSSYVTKQMLEELKLSTYDSEDLKQKIPSIYINSVNDKKVAGMFKTKKDLDTYLQLVKTYGMYVVDNIGTAVDFSFDFDFSVTPVKVGDKIKIELDVGENKKVFDIKDYRCIDNLFFNGNTYLDPDYVHLLLSKGLKGF